MIAAACAAGDSDSAQSSADTATREESGNSADDFEVAADDAASEAMEEGFEPEAPTVAGEDRVSTTGSAGGEDLAQLPDLGRDIIFTATLELASTDVTAATREAIRSIESRGGFLFTQETRGGAGGSSVLTFKVLPEHFQAALNDLGSIGTVRSQSISADDVTAIVVDLESRINTAEASVLRLRDLLDGATELETIATLENQLLQRETSLEQLRGQLRTVRNQVDLATITVFVTELLNRPGISLETMSFAGHDGGFSCFDSPTTRTGEAGDPITACYRITNTGDAPLVDLSIEDAALGATIGTMVVVDGDITQIDPGETVVLAHEFEMSESIRVRAAVTATGLDADGNEIADEVRATAPTVRFDVLNEDDGFPSFGEVLSNSWGALVTAAIVIALIAVAIAPFAAAALVLGVPAVYLVRRIQASRPARSAQPAPPTEPAPPVQPAPAAPADQNPGAGETTVNA